VESPTFWRASTCAATFFGFFHKLRPVRTILSGLGKASDEVQASVLLFDTLGGSVMGIQSAVQVAAQAKPHSKN
jgi:hypothetical protein